MFKEIEPIDVDGFEINLIEDDIYGQIYAPSNFSEFSMLLNKIDLWYNSIEGWRGQSSIEWKVQSSAARRIRNAKLNPLEQKVKEYEQRILEDARSKGFGYREGVFLSDLELLTCLQHYGAATRLIDFTRNVFVALWFACLNNPEQCGLLIGANIYIDDPYFHKLTTNEAKHSNFLDIIEKPENKITIYEPMYLFERMRVQQSVFLFGEVVDGKWGDLQTGDFPICTNQDNIIDRGSFVALAITPALKSDMKEKWRSLFGYNVMNMFPDISGFGHHHAPNQDFEFGFFRSF